MEARRAAWPSGSRKEPHMGTSLGTRWMTYVVLAISLSIATRGLVWAWNEPQDTSRSSRFNVRISHRVTAEIVLRVLNGAHSRLSDERCQRVFSDFSDPSGRPLQTVLDGLGQTAQSYLTLVLFYDGSRVARCSVASNIAVTVTGSRAVYICPAQF